jgi:hypothetical protein
VEGGDAMKSNSIKCLLIIIVSLWIWRMWAADVGLRLSVTFESGGQIEERWKSYETPVYQGDDANFEAFTYSLLYGGPDIIQPTALEVAGLDQSLTMQGYWYSWFSEFVYAYGMRYSTWPAVSFNFLVPTNGFNWIAVEDPQGHIIAVNVAGLSSGTPVSCSWVSTQVTEFPKTVIDLVRVSLEDSQDYAYGETYGPFSLWGYTGPDSPADTNRPQGELAIRADPFNVINGNVQQDETDIAIPAPGLPLVFSRSYNSVDTKGPRKNKFTDLGAILT